MLLDDEGRSIGTAPKATVHTAGTPLHRAFSCYLFSPTGKLLLTRRADLKRTFPGLWTNSVCGHPAPRESDTAAIRRRTRQELQLPATQLTVALPDFRYRASSGGILENEICPVYLGRTSGPPDPDPLEVGAHRWVAWPTFLRALGADPAAFSPWSALQAPELHLSGLIETYLTDLT